MDKLPARLPGLLRGGTLLRRRRSSFCQFLLAALAVLPATLCMGGVLPLTMRVVAAGARRGRARRGHRLLGQHLGAIVGSFAAGFVVLPIARPAARARRAALFAICCWRRRCSVVAPRAARRALAAGVAAAVALALLGLVLPRWSLAHFSAGLFRVSIANEYIIARSQASGQLPELVYYHDGIATTVSRRALGQDLALKNNGKVDASNGDDMATQIMVGLMPLLLRPPRRPAAARRRCVGYGSGVTIGAVTQFPIAHADVVELEPAVVEAGALLRRRTTTARSRTRACASLIGDGRNFLTQRDDKYDVIVSEPSNPWITGVSNLFTATTWKLARPPRRRRRLLPVGAALRDVVAEHQDHPAHLRRGLPLHLRVLGRGSVVRRDPGRQPTTRCRSTSTRARARTSATRCCAPSSSAAASSRPRTSIAYLLLTPDEIPAFTAGSPHQHRRQRAHRVRRAARQRLSWGNCPVARERQAWQAGVSGSREQGEGVPHRDRQDVPGLRAGVHDQERAAALLQLSSDRESGLAGTDHDDIED